MAFQAHINVKFHNYEKVLEFIKQNQGEILQDDKWRTFRMMCVRFEKEETAAELVFSNMSSRN